MRSKTRSEKFHPPAKHHALIRRERRQFACGCSTTRIDSLRAGMETCAAHQGELLQRSVEYEYAAANRGQSV